MNIKLFAVLFLTCMTLSPCPASAVVVINEFLADPPSGLAGDANQDGARHSSHDEFVEIFNRGVQGVDLSGWALLDGAGLRHEFSDHTLLSPLERMVIFGGGTPTGLPGLVLRSSTGSLSLNNSGDTITLQNTLGDIIDQIVYSQEANQDQSLTRFPEGIGEFQWHTDASSTGLRFSPGTDPNGYRTPPNTTTSSVPEPSSMVLLAGCLLLAATIPKRTTAT